MTLEKTLQHFGLSQADLARKLRITPQAIVNWKNRGGIPKGWQARLELMTKGKLKADKGP